MSRGLGVYQRRIVDLLSRDEETIERGLEVAEIRLALAPLDRSNRRRAIRSLLVRGTVEEVSAPETGELVLRLTFREAAAALWRVNPPNYYYESDTYERDTHVRLGTHVRKAPL